MIWAQGRPRTPFSRNLLKNGEMYKFIENGLKCTKKTEKVFSGDFYGFRADRTPPEPVDLLCISMVWGAFGRPGARRGAFSTFYVKIMKIHKIMKILKFHETSRKS